MNFVSKTVPYALLVLTALTSGADGQTADPAQQNQTVSRVIRLRKTENPRVAIRTQTPETEEVRSSVAVSNPASIQFEEFQPKQPVLQHLQKTEPTPVNAQPIPTQAIANQPSQPAPPTQTTESPVTINSTPSISANLQTVDVKATTEPTWNQTEPTSSDPSPVGDQSSSLPADILINKSGSNVATIISAPGHINVNQMAKVDVQVRNDGEFLTSKIKLIAKLPPHVKLQNAFPQPSQSQGQEFEFQLDQLAAGAVQQVSLEVIPTQKQDLQIETKVVMEESNLIAMSVRKPGLDVAIEGPKKSNLGESFRHQVMIKNTGDGLAKAIELQVKHANGIAPTDAKKSIYVPDLAPGQYVYIDLDSIAQQPGVTGMEVSAAAEGIDLVKTQCELTVYQPELQIAASGPKMNFLNREGIYTIKLNNTGLVDVSNVELKLQVSPGMEVTTISREATIDMDAGVLVWSFDEVKANSEQIVQLKTMATAEGQQLCDISVTSNETREKDIRLATVIASRADMLVSVENKSGPVQVGAPAKFEVTVENKGSSDADEVVVNVTLPESLQATNDATETLSAVGKTITFRDGKVAAGQKRKFEFTAIGMSQGEHIVRGMLQTRNSKRQMIAEGSVYVYEVSEARVSESLSPVIKR